MQYFKRKQTELTFCNVTRGLRPSAYVLCVVSAGGISPPTPCLLAGVAYGFGEQGGVCAFLRLATRYEVVQSFCGWCKAHASPAGGRGNTTYQNEESSSPAYIVLALLWQAVFRFFSHIDNRLTICQYVSPTKGVSWVAIYTAYAAVSPR